MRPPQFHLGRFDYTQIPTWVFHNANIIDQDDNMVLCQWRTPSGPVSEWIFKGSPQIMRLFDKFCPNVQQETRHNFPYRKHINRTVRVPRQMIGNAKKHRKNTDQIVSQIDLTGDDDKRENLEFIYLEGRYPVTLLVTDLLYIYVRAKINGGSDQHTE